MFVGRSTLSVGFRFVGYHLIISRTFFFLFFFIFLHILKRLRLSIEKFNFDRIDATSVDCQLADALLLVVALSDIM